MAAPTVENINHLGFEVLEYSAGSPDLSPSDYHIFGLFKYGLWGPQFPMDEDVKEAVPKLLHDKLET